jgi:hypothetical protein
LVKEIKIPLELNSSPSEQDGKPRLVVCENKKWGGGFVVGKRQCKDGGALN